MTVATAFKQDKHRGMECIVSFNNVASNGVADVRRKFTFVIKLK